jgi:hypothetical protein
LALLQEQFGDREAARHFLRAYDISGRIIPEGPLSSGAQEITLSYATPASSSGFDRIIPKKFKTTPIRVKIEIAR